MSSGNLLTKASPSAKLHVSRIVTGWHIPKTWIEQAMLLGKLTFKYIDVKETH